MKKNDFFIGRTKELNELKEFLINSESNIFGLYGVAMIGKSQLVNQFIKSTTFVKQYYKKIIVHTFEASDQNLAGTFEIKLKKEFPKKEFNLSTLSFDHPTLIIIQNFERCLQWYSIDEDLHQIDENHQEIINFLKRIDSIDNVKLILESQLVFNYPDLDVTVDLLKEGELKGVSEDILWKKYEDSRLSKSDFLSIYENLSGHTWLLFFALEQSNVVLKNNLKKAINRPESIIYKLWKILREVVAKLNYSDTLLLCAMTLKRKIFHHALIDNLSQIATIDRDIVFESIESLERKLLLHEEDGFLEINPFLQQVCYSFIRNHRAEEFKTLRQLPFFNVLDVPNYNLINQYQLQGDFGGFYNEIKKIQNEEKYEAIIEILDYVYKTNPTINKVGVLNKKGIIYKKQRKYNKAISVLHQAHEKEPNNIEVLTDIAIIHKSQKNYDKAIEVLEQALKVDHEDVEALNELGMIQKSKGEINKAIETLRMASRFGNAHSFSELVKIFLEQKNYQLAFNYASEGLKHFKNDDLLKEQKKLILRLASDLKANAVFSPEEKFYPRKKKRKEKKKRHLPQYSYWKRLLDDDKLVKFCKEFAEDVQQNGYHYIKSCLQIELTRLKIAKSPKTYDFQTIIKARIKLRNLLEEYREDYEFNSNDFFDNNEFYAPPKKIFLSYANKDEVFKEELDVQLAPLKLHGKVDIWQNQRIVAGSNRNDEISNNLRMSDVICLLISADYIHSENCRLEMEEALKHEQKNTIIIPIIVRDCLWEELKFDRFHLVPKDGKPINSFPDRDLAYKEVVLKIKNVL